MKNLWYKVIASLLVVLVFACSKDDQPEQSAPSVVTDTISMIMAKSAVLYGEVSAENNSAVVTRGFCYSLEPNPDTTDSVVIAGLGSGPFNAEVTGLNPETEYFFRAFATNAIGTSYGDNKTFTTLRALPILQFKTGWGYTTQDTTIYAGETVKIGVSAKAEEPNKLIRFRLTDNHNDLQLIIADSSFNSSDFDWDLNLQFSGSSYGVNQLIFELQDTDNNVVKDTLNITTVGIK